MSIYKESNESQFVIFNEKKRTREEIHAWEKIVEIYKEFNIEIKIKDETMTSI